MSKEKSMGQYFTPAYIAQLMSDLISDGSKKRKILEPSAGKGIFLEILTTMGYQNLYGIEIDPTIANQSAIPIYTGNFFDFPISKKFDVVIGNPPYIRWKNLPIVQREYFSSTSFWQKRMNGLTDILQPFIFKSVDHLNLGGELIFITPIFWMQTLHAEPLRRFLLENGSLEVILNFHETQIFPKANLNLVIFKYRKSKQNQPLKVINYWQKGKLKPNILARVRWLLLESSSWEPYSQRDENLEFFETHQPYNSLPWWFLPRDIEKKLARFEQACQFSPKININGETTRFSYLFSADDLVILDNPLTSYKKVKYGSKNYFIVPRITQLTKYFTKASIPPSSPPSRFVRVGDVVEIGNGMVSGLDKAFRLSQNIKLTKKEKKLIIPVVKAKAIRRYYAEYLTNYFLVKPGDIPSEAVLRKDYPSLFEQLKPYRSTLEKRYQYNRKIPYWEWVFIRNYNLMKNAEALICVPCKDRFDKRGFVRFALSEQGIFTTQDVTVLVKFNWVKESPEYITAFLNCKEIFDWITNKGLIRGGVAEFSEEPLKNIPFRLINWKSSSERQIHDRIKLLVKEIQKKELEDTSKISKINELISRLLKG
ncbi:MAG: Eco57I restriction-modification methylase domain-containing protein [Candidatus Heimdallarchaeota archaeon]|nr:MAG: Eco57I restriction-modification methylase domain-containing protein [Candidatus Heimdallarchaeota archaeon]